MHINKIRYKRTGIKTIFLFLFVYFLIINPCYAAPCYGTRLPQKNQFFVGLQTHSVLNRYLKDTNGKMRSLQNFLLVSYGIFDWLSLDLKGGAGYIKHQPAAGQRIDYSTYLGGGYGFRIKLYDHNKTAAVFGFQHISIHPHKVHVNGRKNKAVLDDWQFSLLASYDLSLIIPYIGTKWSRMDYINWIDSVRNRVKSDTTRSIGLAVGADIPLGERIWINIEGQFFDVEAFATSLNFSF